MLVAILNLKPTPLNDLPELQATFEAYRRIFLSLFDFLCSLESRKLCVWTTKLLLVSSSSDERQVFCFRVTLHSDGQAHVLILPSCSSCVLHIVDSSDTPQWIHTRSFVTSPSNVHIPANNFFKKMIEISHCQTRNSEDIDVKKDKIRIYFLCIWVKFDY